MSKAAHLGSAGEQLTLTRLLPGSGLGGGGRRTWMAPRGVMADPPGLCTPLLPRPPASRFGCMGRAEA